MGSVPGGVFEVDPGLTVRRDDQLEGFFIPAVLPSVEEKVTCPLLGAGAARTVEAEDKKGFLSEGKEPLVVFSPVKEKPPSPGRFGDRRWR